MSQLESFRQHVEAFLAESEMSATQFGKDALGDPSFIPDLRSGRAPNLATVDRVMRFIEAKREVGEPQASAA